MDFLTAYYKQKNTGDVSLLLQQYEWRGRHICFACLAEACEGRAAAYVTEQLLSWFRMASSKRLTKMVSNLKLAERIGREIEFRLGQTDEELEHSGLVREGEGVSLSCMLCVEDAFIVLQRGSMRINSFNTSLGRSCMETLAPVSKEGMIPTAVETARQAAWRVQLEYGFLQRDVCLLLATEAFCTTLGETYLKEGLNPGNLTLRAGVERHLAELGLQGEALKGEGMAAVLLKSSETAPHKMGERAVKRDSPPLKRGEGCRADRPKQPGENLAGHPDRYLPALGYECICLLGSGAFARVYKVREMATGRFFACKVSSHKKLLEQEFWYMRAMQHPLFPEVYEYRELAGEGMMRMEYIAGESLEEKLVRRNHFSEAQTARFGMALAEGLLYLHEQRQAFLFRDMKPENIMITERGGVKLLDFGCVCVREKGRSSLAGSPGYAAPEQLSGGEIDVTADVYGLGRTLEAALGTHLKRAGRLRTLIDTCTREDGRKRLPDMRSVLCVLAPLGEAGRGKGCLKSKRMREWRKRTYQKNIWESTYKRA